MRQQHRSKQGAVPGCVGWRRLGGVTPGKAEKMISRIGLTKRRPSGQAEDGREGVMPMAAAVPLRQRRGANAGPTGQVIGPPLEHKHRRPWAPAGIRSSLSFCSTAGGFGAPRSPPISASAPRPGEVRRQMGSSSPPRRNPGAVCLPPSGSRCRARSDISCCALERRHWCLPRFRFTQSGASGGQQRPLAPRAATAPL